MTAGKQIALQPAFAHMLGQHGVHDTAVCCQMIIRIIVSGVPVTVLYVEDGVQTVGIGFIGSEDTEIPCVLIEDKDIPDEFAELGHILAVCFPVFCNRESVIPEIRKSQIAEQKSAVSVRIAADPCVSLRGEFFEFRDQAAVFIEQLFRMIALEPFYQNVQMLFLIHHDRNLVGQEVAFDPLSVHDLRAGPAFGSPKNDHRPYRTGVVIVFPGMLLDFLNPFDDLVHGLSHAPVHRHGIIAFHKVGLPAAAMEEVYDFLVAHTRKDRRIGDLIAVQMQNGKNRTVSDGI